MLITVEIEPPELMAEMVYCVVVISSVGVPERIPVVELKVIPSGSSPTISHVTTAPGPVVIGSCGIIAVLLVSQISGFEKDRVVGTSSITVMLNVDET